MLISHEDTSLFHFLSCQMISRTSVNIYFFWPGRMQTLFLSVGQQDRSEKCSTVAGLSSWSISSQFMLTLLYWSTCIPVYHRPGFGVFWIWISVLIIVMQCELNNTSKSESMGQIGNQMCVQLSYTSSKTTTGKVKKKACIKYLGKSFWDKIIDPDLLTLMTELYQKACRGFINKEPSWINKV